MKRLLLALCLLLGAILLPGVADAACVNAKPIDQSGALGSPFVTSGVTGLEKQTSDNVHFTGGCIDGTPVGQNTPAAGSFSTLTQGIASCDGFSATDGAITTGTKSFASASASFAASDVGKPLTIAGAGAAGANLVTTVAAFVDKTHITTADAASATVSGATWGYGTDYSSAINAAIATGVRLPQGKCGVASSVALASKTTFLGQAAGTGAKQQTTLLWLGAVGGTPVSLATGGAASGVVTGNYNVDGLCSAATGVSLKGMAGSGSVVYPIVVSNTTTSGIDFDSYVAESQFWTAINPSAQVTSTCAASAKGIRLGVSGNVNHATIIGASVQHANGTGFECGNADSNTVVGYEGQQIGGSGLSLDLLAGATPQCRSNVFLSADPLGGTTAETGVSPSANNFIFLNKESGAPDPTINGSATLYWQTNQGFTFGKRNWLTPVSPSNPTSTTALAAAPVMMGLGSQWGFTPKASGRGIARITGIMSNTTNGDGVAVVARYGTGTAPANAAAATGTICAPTMEKAAVTAASEWVPFTAVCSFTGAAPGTALWFDVSVGAVTGGTASIFNLKLEAEEK